MLKDYVRVIHENQVSIADRSGSIVGVLVLVVTASGVLLENVAVHPAHQRMGIGRMLLERAETEALRQGFESIRLYTHEKMVENLSLYERFGYVEYDRLVENGYARVYMRKLLA
jgi:ribosomal protein S18 acetylase RimI-like enzyme